MSYKLVKKEMYNCLCERCTWAWITDRLPKACAKCKSRSWNKPKKEKIE